MLPHRYERRTNNSNIGKRGTEVLLGRTKVIDFQLDVLVIKLRSTDWVDFTNAIIKVTKYRKHEVKEEEEGEYQDRQNQDNRNLFISD